MSRARIERTEATLGAIVTGVRLAALDEADWHAIEDAFHEAGVLIFPGQHLESPDQVAFASRFGEIEHLFGTSGIVPISNRNRDGTFLEEDSGPMQILRGNEGWHTDSSYMPLAAKASMLSADVVPASGGETEWADMRAAFDALDDATRERIAKLSAHHSLRYSQSRIGDTKEFGYGFHDGPVPVRSLVKVHPVTGRRSLFIGRHAYGIPGLAADESERLLEGLLDFACRSPRVLQHRWQPGDVAIWDNRCLLHRARPYDPMQPRALRHTRIAGDPTTEAA